MTSLEEIIAAARKEIEGVELEILPNPSPADQPSILVGKQHALEFFRFLESCPDIAMDYASNVTGVDWPETVVKEKRKVSQVVDGETVEKEETVEVQVGGYLETVYHLYSMSRQTGPIVVRMRTGNRIDDVDLPSITAIYRSAELQEREIFDLFGIRFTGHPDLRRILMWDEFEDHPMRKDYVEPDDYEYEPTPHHDVLEKASSHLERRDGC